MRPGPWGTPFRLTAVKDGPMPVTPIALMFGAKVEPNEARIRCGERRHATRGSCSIWSGDEAMIECDNRDFARTVPSGSTTTPLTDVVPMSIPTANSVDRDGPFITPPGLGVTG